MPDAYGNFKGQGWSQKRSDAWERVFGRCAWLMEGDAVDVVLGELAGARGTVIRDDGNTVWVLTDRGDNPVLFETEELRRCAESAEENPNRESSGPTA